MWSRAQNKSTQIYQISNSSFRILKERYISYGPHPCPTSEVLSLHSLAFPSFSLGQDLQLARDVYATHKNIMVDWNQAKQKKRKNV